CLDAPTMQFCKTLYQSQAESKPPATAICRLIGLGKWIEDASKYVGLHPDSSVFHGNLGTGRSKGERQCDSSAGACELHPIVEKIGDDLLPARFISKNPNGCYGNADIELQT